MQTARAIEILYRALARRDSLRSDSTNCLRLCDGSGDGLDGLEIEDFAGNWLVTTRDIPFPDWITQIEGLPYRSLYWRDMSQNHSHPPQHCAGVKLTQPFLVCENRASYWIDFAAGMSVGIFLDQRLQRQKIRQLATSRHIASILNCYAYTAGFSVMAALGGAQCTTLDLSSPYLNWGEKNFVANQLEPQEHQWISGDVREWLPRLRRQNYLYDLIVLDPPSFSRTKKGKVFRIAKDYPELVAEAIPLLRPHGTLLCTTNYRQIDQHQFTDLVHRGAQAWQTPLRLEPGDMPPDFTGEKYLKALWATKA